MIKISIRHWLTPYLLKIKQNKRKSRSIANVGFPTDKIKHDEII